MVNPKRLTQFLKLCAKIVKKNLMKQIFAEKIEGASKTLFFFVALSLKYINFVDKFNEPQPIIKV